MEKTTQQFFKAYQQQHFARMETVDGIDNPHDQHPCAKLWLSRLNGMLPAWNANHPLLRPEIAHYLAERTIHQLVLTRMGAGDGENIPDLLARLDKTTALRLVYQVLPNIKILDPAVGSGTFLVAAFTILFSMYKFIYETGFLDEPDTPFDTPFDLDVIKSSIITHNLYGVDIVEEAIEITKLRLSLCLPATSPIVFNSFNLFSGNALLGCMRTDVQDVKMIDMAEQKPCQKPFHWNWHFPEIMQQNGGFDIILTHPPKDKSSHLWITPWYKKSSAPINDIDYHHQTSPKINPPALFVERCFHLLRSGGQCGMLLPSGIYTDLGTKGVRDLLFEQTQIQGLFCFENGKSIFKEADSRSKWVILHFTKGGQTHHFPASFMRHTIEELSQFPQEGALQLSVDFIRRLSPDSHSVMEFKNELDIQIAEKMLQFPLLGERMEGVWNLTLTRALNITSDQHLLATEPAAGRLPLYEGRMIGQFDTNHAAPRFWVTVQDNHKILPYRFAMRKSASNHNERTLVATVLPPHVFGADSLYLAAGDTITLPEQIYLAAVANSFIMDAFLRNKIASSINQYMLFQLPIPRLIASDSRFMPIAQRAARLICTTPEFDKLAQIMGLQGHQDGITDPIRRTRMRAELDGLIAHLYGLSEEELVHILESFPLVDETAKIATLNAYWRAKSRE